MSGQGILLRNAKMKVRRIKEEFDVKEAPESQRLKSGSASSSNQPSVVETERPYEPEIPDPN